MKTSYDTIENRTRDLPACSVVPQPPAPPRAPNLLLLLLLLLLLHAPYEARNASSCDDNVVRPSVRP
jgi:MYXO-CTERM domain-containing protein